MNFIIIGLILLGIISIILGIIYKDFIIASIIIGFLCFLLAGVIWSHTIKQFPETLYEPSPYTNFEYGVGIEYGSPKQQKLIAELLNKENKIHKSINLPEFIIQALYDYNLQMYNEMSINELQNKLMEVNNLLF